MKKLSEEFLRVSIHMMIDGELINMKKVKYQRGSETIACTLDDLGRIIFMWERMFSGGSTYAMDGFLQKAEKKLPKKNNETAQSVFEKYWINLEKTINQEFEELNKGDNDPDATLFPEVNDYLTFLISQECRGFNLAPLPIQYGFLYWLFKYVMNGSIDEIQTEINNVPDYIKEIVDNKIVKKD
jgi:hypothetical protein